MNQDVNDIIVDSMHVILVNLQRQFEKVQNFLIFKKLQYLFNSLFQLLYNKLQHIFLYFQICYNKLSTMPRVHGQAKQKNKPFKGKSKGNKSNNKIAKTKTKLIAKTKGTKIASKHQKKDKKQMIKQIKMRKINEVEKLTQKNQYLDQETKNIISEKMKYQNQIKIVLLLPCNQDADCQTLIKAIYESLNKENVYVKTQMNAFRSFSSFQLFPIANKSFLRSKIQFIAPKRDIEQLIDLAKCSDIIVPILSCKSTNTQRMNLNPFEEGKAFDENGYTILNMVRTLGVPTTIGVIQHLELHQNKHHDKITRLFKRFMTSQLGDQQKVLSISNFDDINKLLRQIDSINPHPQSWKNQRGYMMVQSVRQAQNGNLIFQGFLKGNCINANQLAHITGFDDYQIQSIEIKQHQGKIRKQKKNVMDQQIPLIQHSTFSQSLFPFAKAQEKNHNNDDLLSALQGLKFQAQNPKESKGMNEQQNQQDYEDMSQQDQENNQLQQQLDSQEILGNKDDQKAKRIQMQMRKQDEMEFQDQVQYTGDQLLRQKYRNYQGLKNFKTSEWNSLENLPEEYDRIFTFKHYSKTQSNVMKENISKGFAYPGFFVSVTIKGFPKEKLQKHLERFPLIMSFLLKHERKMTTLHGRVKRNPYYPQNDVQIQSNQTYLISMGFRKFYTKPIFSRCMNGTQKTKYVKKITQDYQNYFYCSFYYYNYFPPAPFGIYRTNSLNLQQVEPCPIMYGQLAKCDPLHIILQRIILCGYPYKINKRRSTVRFMFFNPKDVKFFKPIEVRSKMGLRGRIQESLGTHGLMKVMFSDRIKHNDTVCMYLYNRVYPIANF